MSNTPTMPHPIPEPLADAIAARLRAIAEPMRIRLLDYLREDGASIQEIADALGTSQQNASKHVGLLKQHGMLAVERDGNKSIVSINDPSVFSLCDSVCGGLNDHVDNMSTLIKGDPS